MFGSESLQLLQAFGLLRSLIVEPADQAQQREDFRGVRSSAHPSGVRNPGTQPGRTLAVETRHHISCDPGIGNQDGQLRPLDGKQRFPTVQQLFHQFFSLLVIEPAHMVESRFREELGFLGIIGGSHLGDHLGPARGDRDSQINGLGREVRH